MMTAKLRGPSAFFLIRKSVWKAVPRKPRFRTAVLAGNQSQRGLCWPVLAKRDAFPSRPIRVQDHGSSRPLRQSPRFLILTTGHAFC